MPDRFITFENQIMIDYTSFIHGFILSTLVLIEQKSLGKELNKSISHSFHMLDVKIGGIMVLHLIAKIKLIAE